MNEAHIDMYMTYIKARSPKVIVITPWYGGSDGGVAVVTHALIQGLTRAGVACAAIEIVADAIAPRVTRGSCGEVIIALCLRDHTTARSLLSKLGAMTRDYLATRAFKSLLPTDGSPCVAHFHYTSPLYAQFVKLCERYDIPIVSTFHGGDLDVNLRDPRTYEVAKLQVNQSGAVTAVSQSLRETTMQFFPDIDARLSVIYNAVPPDFSASIEKHALTDTRDIDVLFVGNLIARKGADVLIHAWAAVQRARPSSRLALAGDGDALDSLKSLAKDLGIEQSVDFLGRQSRSDLPALYQRAKVLAVPSRSEPLGVVVLEGAASGAAVVASNTGGIPEIIKDGETGLLVAVDAPDQLADALLRVLNDDMLRQKLAEAGRLRVATRFGMARIVKEYRAIYSQLVGES